MRADFPTPDHDHARCSADVLSHAETLCRQRKQRLTPMRRQVLNALAASHRPIGAYEIMERVAADGTRPAPITVYRALDFLIEQGLVHRIESRNAFLACAHRLDASFLPRPRKSGTIDAGRPIVARFAAMIERGAAP